MTDSQQTRILPDDFHSGSLGIGSVLRQRYRLNSELGRGGMGIVYQATDLELHREVAVKVVSATASPSDARARLLREARAAAALNHPHIIAVHDVGEASGQPFFVMEFVGGPRLSEARPVELARIVEVATQICSALEHAHSNGIVHRDLKPDNVLLSRTDELSNVKLADLGLALPAYGARISQVGMIVGTAAYMAPEQALGQPVDGRTDLYALGVLLYELTTGRVPFSGNDPLTIVSQHVHAPVVPPRVLRPDLPRALEALILRLLAKDPEQRFRTAAETRTALLSCLTDQSNIDADAGSAVAILDALSRGRLVGRATELAEARELWRRAREGHGHAVLLSGEPGAGKTRLAREITIQAAVDGALVLSGGCYEYEATTPYLPFVEAFRRWVREEKDDTKLRSVLGDAATQIAKLAPEIETRLGPFPERHQLAAHEERLLFFDAVAQVFSNAARQQSLLFYADDLHWADRGTLWLLGHLLRQLKEERVLIVGAYRETELDRAHPLAKAFVDWNRERLVTRIMLRRFNQSETEDQLGALLGEKVSGEFAQVVHRETEGNPFFVEEVLKALIERGSVRRESGRWKRCDLTELLIPQSVKEAIGHRLDGVSEQCNDILRVSAILGKVFTFEELAVAAEQNEDILLDALDEAVAAQLLAPGPDDSFVFTHDKIREVLYEELNPIRRRRLHRHAAEGLEQSRNKLSCGCTVEKLAHHYILAGDHERGLHYAKQAAIEAQRVFAFEEAIAAYSRAAECAEALGLVDEQRAQEEIGKAYLLHGEMIPAGEHFERALALTTEPAVRARLQCQAAASLVATGDQRGLEFLREALAVLDPVANPLDTANALATEARFHHLAGRHKKAIELLQRAAELVRPTAEGPSVETFAAPLIAQIYAWAAGAHQHYGLYADADEWARCAIAFGKKHNIPFAEAVGYEFLGENATHAGNYEVGLQCAQHEREIAEKLHSRERTAWMHFYSAQCHLGLGHLKEAERESLAGIGLAEAIGENRVLALLKTSYAVMQAMLGKHDEALEAAERSMRATQSEGLLYTRFEGLRCLANVRFLRAQAQKSKSAGTHGNELVRIELNEAERICAEAAALIDPTESRVSKLWLGPLYLDVLLDQKKLADSENDQETATQKLSEAKKLLATYEKLVADCQSPRFTKEAERLVETIRAAKE